MFLFSYFLMISAFSSSLTSHNKSAVQRPLGGPLPCTYGACDGLRKVRHPQGWSLRGMLACVSRVSPREDMIFACPGHACVKVDVCEIDVKRSVAIINRKKLHRLLIDKTMLLRSNSHCLFTGLTEMFHILPQNAEATVWRPRRHNNQR